jgi:ABC-type glutathione transport system ATPase component
VSALGKMEAIETIVSLQISGELEAFAPKPLIVGRGLTKVYRNDAFEVRVLDGVDIDLYEGEIVVFLREVGSQRSSIALTVSTFRRPDC